MKGLLLKDFYVLTGKLKFLLILMFLFAVIPNSPQIAFAMVYGALFPIAIMGYDERSKWDKLARTMPYASADFALSKYLLGYSAMCLTAGISIISTMTLGPLADSRITLSAYLLTKLIPSLLCGFLVLALGLPLIIHLGVTKGQMLFIVLAIVVMLLGFNFIGRQENTPSSFTTFTPSLLLLLGIAVIALNIVSIFLSIHFYKVKEA